MSGAAIRTNRCVANLLVRTAIVGDGRAADAVVGTAIRANGGVPDLVVRAPIAGQSGIANALIGGLRLHRVRQGKRGNDHGGNGRDQGQIEGNFHLVEGVTAE